MKTLYSLSLVLLIGCALCGCFSQRDIELFVMEHNRPSSNLRVRPYSANEHTFIPKFDPPQDFNYVDFLVAVHNRTPHPFYFDEEWNSWGYDLLELDLRKADGTIYRLVKQEGNWHRNFPSMLIIPPQSFLAYPVSIDRGIWKNVPEMGIGEEIEVRARLWTGYSKKGDAPLISITPKIIESAWMPVIFRGNRVTVQWAIPTSATSP